jgi:hypothetical protein
MNPIKKFESWRNIFVRVNKYGVIYSLRVSPRPFSRVNRGIYQNIKFNIKLFNLREIKLIRNKKCLNLLTYFGEICLLNWKAIRSYLARLIYFKSSGSLWARKLFRLKLKKNVKKLRFNQQNFFYGFQILSLKNCNLYFHYSQLSNWKVYYVIYCGQTQPRIMMNRWAKHFIVKIKPGAVPTTTAAVPLRNFYARTNWSLWLEPTKLNRKGSSVINHFPTQIFHLL